jgi:hypothetical protein
MGCSEIVSHARLQALPCDLPGGMPIVDVCVPQPLVIVAGAENVWSDRPWVIDNFPSAKSPRWRSAA